MRPFLKWAGNKHAILVSLLPMLPEGNRLIEPFVGSGAVFLNTAYPAYLLADSNADLIGLYQTLQAEGTAFIAYCRSFFTPEANTPEAFYQLREAFNQTGDARLKAALFVYLNRHGYNGLCRYNRNGGFNVPFGRYKAPHFPEEAMRYFHEKSQDAEFRHSDFADTMAQAQPGDVVYCDPPYVPLSVTASFTSYGPLAFGQPQQEHLARLAGELAQRGVSVVISNHDTPFTQAVYHHAAEIIPFEVRRYISCNGANRGKVGEILALFAP